MKFCKDFWQLESGLVKVHKKTRNIITKMYKMANNDNKDIDKP